MDQNRSVVSLDENQKRSIRSLFGSFQRGDLQPKGHHQTFMSDYRRHLEANATQSVTTMSDNVANVTMKSPNVANWRMRTSENVAGSTPTSDNVANWRVRASENVTNASLTSPNVANATSTSENVADVTMKTSENVANATSTSESVARRLSDASTENERSEQKSIKTETSNHSKQNTIKLESSNHSSVVESWESLPTLADVKSSDETSNSDFLEKLRRMQKDPKFVNMLQFRKKLPAFEKKNELVKLKFVIMSFAVIISYHFVIK